MYWIGIDRNLPESQFDIIYLSNRHPQRRFQSLASITDKFNLGLIRRGTTGADAYVITKRAMLRLLDNFPYFELPVDIFLQSYWLHGLKVLYIKSPIHSGR